MRERLNACFAIYLSTYRYSLFYCRSNVVCGVDRLCYLVTVHHLIWIRETKNNERLSISLRKISLVSFLDSKGILWIFRRFVKISNRNRQRKLFARNGKAFWDHLGYGKNGHSKPQQSVKKITPSQIELNYQSQALYRLLSSSTYTKIIKMINSVQSVHTYTGFGFFCLRRAK